MNSKTDVQTESVSAFIDRVEAAIKPKQIQGSYYDISCGELALCLTRDRTQGQGFSAGFCSYLRVNADGYYNPQMVTGRDLRGFIFDHSRLNKLHFKDCDLTNTHWRGARLSGVIFENCKLADSSWHQSMLYDVKFVNCDLSDSWICFAGRDNGVFGVHVVGSVGRLSRTIYSWVYNNKIHIQVGCTVYTQKTALAAIQAEYRDTPERDLYKAAVRMAYKLAKHDLTEGIRLGS